MNKFLVTLIFLVSSVSQADLNVQKPQVPTNLEVQTLLQDRGHVRLEEGFLLELKEATINDCQSSVGITNCSGSVMGYELFITVKGGEIVHLFPRAKN